MDTLKEIELLNLRDELAQLRRQFKKKGRSRELDLLSENNRLKEQLSDAWDNNALLCQKIETLRHITRHFTVL